jgi:Butirosin biosynthesis protein H, N-terminal
VRVELPVRHWRHELVHCLHTTAGVLLQHHGLNPVEVLGAGWGFHHPGEVRREEYFLPGDPDALFAGLAPHHRIRSRWHRPADAAQGWREVRAELAAGRPTAVAVDNFHLPFRPAFGDVHTNHLLVVHGVDDHTAEVLVTDPVPPAFQGPITLDQLTAARDSGNAARHDRDMFFTANPIRNRWLELDVDAEQPRFDPGFVLHVLAENLRGFTDPAEPSRTGLPRLRTFLDRSWDRLPAAPEVVDEVFIVAGPALAVTGLHSAFLERAGRRFADAALLELSRRVDAVAHQWAALRIAVATARSGREMAVAALRRRSIRLVTEYERALDAIARHLSGISLTAGPLGGEAVSRRCVTVPVEGGRSDRTGLPRVCG